MKVYLPERDIVYDVYGTFGGDEPYFVIWNVELGSFESLPVREFVRYDDEMVKMVGGHATDDGMPLDSGAPDGYKPECGDCEERYECFPELKKPDAPSVARDAMFKVGLDGVAKSKDRVAELKRSMEGRYPGMTITHVSLSADMKHINVAAQVDDQFFDKPAYLRKIMD